MSEEHKIPQVGDDYYSCFESDGIGDHERLEIEEVIEEFHDGIYNIVASDGVGYDCVWSEVLQVFVYSLD